MELISRDEVMRLVESGKLLSGSFGERAKDIIESIPTVEERKVGEWIRTGRTNVYGGEELMCPFCGDRVMVQNIEYELYCRQCGALLGDRYEVEEVE